jgi:thiol-disulfide isomerase/thioredoxin
MLHLPSSLTRLIVLTFSFSILMSATAEAKLKKGDQFPTPVLPALNGKGSIDLAKYKGKVVIVDFWASWCEPCKIELPYLNGLNKKYKGKNVVIIGVNLDEKQGDAVAFLKDHPVQLPLAYDGAKKVLAEKAEIEVMPTSFIIDKNGVIAERHQAFREGDGAKIEQEVAALLKK